MFKKDEMMWFGTKDHMRWVKPPLAGADSSPVGWGVDGTLLNGHGFVTNSYNSHKTYSYAWSGASTRQEAQIMKSFADGSFGRGKIYFQEPNIYDTNVLQARLADPSITLGYEGPDLVPGVTPSSIATSGFETNRLPVRSVSYSPGSTLPLLNSANVMAQDNFIPVPDGKSLLVQAFYKVSSGSSLGVYVVAAAAGGIAAASGTILTPTANTGSVSFQVFDKTPGVIGYYIFIGRTGSLAAGVSTQITAIHARIADTGTTMIGEPYWMGGQGHNGVRFVGKPTYVTRGGINGGMIEYAASFKEVQN